MHDAFRLTWREVTQADEKREAVCTIEGYLLCSRDKRLDTHSAYYEWKHDVALAMETGRLNLPAATERPTNAKGKPFTWSFSAMNEFDTCPEQYAAKRYWCTLKDDGNYATSWGKKVHEALEHRVGKNKQLPGEMAEYEKYAIALDKNARDGNTIVVEQQVAINQNFEITGWFDDDAWGRAALDVLMSNGEVVGIYDWKTGKMKDNPLQLKIFAAFASLIHPKAEKFITKYIWLNHSKITGEEYSKTDIPIIWSEINTKLARMEEAWTTETFQPRSSGLCGGFCGVTNCPHWRPGKAKR